MSTATEYDCIVIGAGIMGSFTAYELAKNNKKTLLLEQFLMPHSRGGSHGQTRIMSQAYREDFYCHMMGECYKLWSELEKEAGVTLFKQTGLLTMGPVNKETYYEVEKTLQDNKVSMMILDKDNFKEHFPNNKLSKGEGAVLDKLGGIVFGDRALSAVQGLFVKLGGVITDNASVTNIKPGPVVTVSTLEGDYRAKSVVMTAGAWTNKLLAHTDLKLPLTPNRINVCFWKEKVPGTYSVKNNFPCFTMTQAWEGSKAVCGLPSIEYPGMMKILYFKGEDADPDQRDINIGSSDIDAIRTAISHYFTGLELEPSVVESGMYMFTPDDNFVLDCHPKHKNIVIGAGFSGHGFKFAPLIGKFLHDLSQGKKPSYDLSPFSIERFQN